MRRRGFTLIEMVVVIALTSLVMVMLGSLIVYFYTTNAYVFQQSTATLEARRGLDETTRYLREAAYASDGTAPIQVAATSTLTFYVDLNHDTSLERVTYTITNGTLMRSVLNPPTGIPALSTISAAVRNGTSTPMFRYFDKTGAELTMPVTVTNIASVKTTLVIQVDPNRGPAALTLTGTAVLRNAQSHL